MTALRIAHYWVLCIVPPVCKNLDSTAVVSRASVGRGGNRRPIEESDCRLMGDVHQGGKQTARTGGTMTTIRCILVAALVLVGASVQGQQKTAARNTPSTVAVKSVWTDRTPGGATFEMWDLWQDDRTTLRGFFPGTTAPQVFQPNKDLWAVIELVKKTPVKSEFEKTSEFAERKQTFDAELDRLLVTPLVFPAKRQLTYNADKELMVVGLVVGHDYLPGRELTQLDTVYPLSLDLATPTGTFGTDGVGAFVCAFPMSPEDAKIRMENLSVLLAVRARASEITYHLVDPGDAFGKLRFEVSPAAIEVWLVDRVKKERVGLKPLVSRTK